MPPTVIEIWVPDRSNERASPTWASVALARLLVIKPSTAGFGVHPVRANSAVFVPTVVGPDAAPIEVADHVLEAPMCRGVPPALPPPVWLTARRSPIRTLTSD